jgi:NADPH:quinone reductase-like Zn-dependent oxidoreductase
VLKGKNFDAFYDCVGGYECWQAAAAVLKPSGSFVTISGDNPSPFTVGRIVSIVTSSINRKFWAAVSAAPSYDQFLRAASGADMQQLVDWLAAGRLRVPHEPAFEFSKAGAIAMFDRQHSGRASGALVMTIADEKKIVGDNDDNVADDDDDDDDDDNKA